MKQKKLQVYMTLGLTIPGVKIMLRVVYCGECVYNDLQSAGYTQQMNAPSHPRGSGRISGSWPLGARNIVLISWP